MYQKELNVQLCFTYALRAGEWNSVDACKTELKSSKEKQGLLYKA